MQVEWDATEATSNLYKHSVSFDEAINVSFESSVRGKYAARYANATNIVVIDPLLTKAFPNRGGGQRCTTWIARTRYICDAADESLDLTSANDGNARKSLH